MRVEHLPNTATVEEATEVLREHGHVIIDELVPASVMRQIEEEMQPYVDASPYGSPTFSGTKTRRTGCVIARSTTARDLVMHPLTLGVARTSLAAPVVQLSSTEMISLEPGQPSQVLHRDDMAAGRYPFPLDFPVYCNSIWAITDFTDENGATRLVPGSHLAPFTNDVFGEESPERYSHEDTVPAEMASGSVLMFSGKIVHGSGANESSSVRRGLSLPQTLWWIRQEENQFLACPQEIARTLPEDLLRLMGYESSLGLGHAGGQTDPLSVLHR
jgi:ectoine hydroxylase-related dioxygenase (phytanoyl-CoA dioxygenase family)